MPSLAMAFRLILNGVPIECDTAAEAMALANVQAPSPAHPQIPRKKVSPRASANGSTKNDTPPELPEVVLGNARAWVESPPDDIVAFCADLLEHERLALGLLATHGGEVSLDELCQVAGLSENRDGSLMINRWKRLAEKRHLDVSRIFTHRIAGARKERRSFYKPGPLLEA